MLRTPYFRKYTARFFGPALALVAAACSDNLEFRELPSSEYVTFHATMRADSLHAESRSSVDKVAVHEEDWSLTADGKGDSGASRATLTTTLTGNAGIVAYQYDKSASPIEKTPVINRTDYYFSEDILTNTASSACKWSDISEPQLDVYAYAPIEGVTFKDNTGTPSIQYTVNDKISEQKDLIVASATVADVTANNKRAVNLNFRHALTAIRFKAGFECKVKSLTVSGVYKSGEYSVWDDTGNGNWQRISSTDVADGSYKVSFGDGGKTVGKDDYIVDGDNTLILMPQVLPDGAMLTLELSDQTLEIPLKHFVWSPGMLITYTIYKETAPTYIYLDLAAGHVRILATSYDGYRFPVGDETVDPETKKVKVTGNHSSKNLYYVYQSSPNVDGTRNGSYDPSTGTFTRPVYGDIKVGNKSWKEYITNNKNVEDVIDKWETAASAAGMQASDYCINVFSLGGECNITIDNIYSKYEQKAGHYTSRNAAGIGFKLQDSDKNNRLVINIVGDNRLGAIHYDNIWPRNNNKLILKGNGSLTVADPQGNGSNYWNSAIGNNDGKSHCYGIQIDGGIIFAGTKQAENCTAIGGGGNGVGEVTINGGVVTAVASTTGTAIGGGIGFNLTGGVGSVTITGGTVYAYNLDNGHKIPSSAIGGAGSKFEGGATGKVNISGGTVYAYSELGTAIGGGSSFLMEGGDAVVNITGGDITAISAARGSCGIGGGTSYTQGYYDKDITSWPGKYNGGVATINISGNPVIRTGSIGGGGTGDKDAKIGYALIDISGGTTQAQFIMAAGSYGTPKFTMSGGTVVGITDNKFNRALDLGGAVYLEDGECTLSGNAVIENCTAQRGGAVYVEGGIYTMTGGTIHDCMSTGNGGAIYMNNGTVKITGGTLHNNLAYGGNGGGVYISGGDFTMDGSAVEMTENSAVNKISDDGTSVGGYGGAVYVTSARDVYVDLLAGDISKNTCEKKGGGVCVRMRESSTSTAIVTVGTKGGDENNPSITGNHALLQGGGLYVEGQNAQTTIVAGKISDNTVTAYVPNQDVSNEGGLVKLEGGTVTHSVITFHANYAGASPATATTKIVTATNSRLVTPVDADGKDIIIRTGYRLDSWNTKADGTGTAYTGGSTIYVESNTDLYAQWAK